MFLASIRPVSPTSPLSSSNFGRASIARYWQAVPLFSNVRLAPDGYCMVDHPKKTETLQALPLIRGNELTDSPLKVEHHVWGGRERCCKQEKIDVGVAAQQSRVGRAHGFKRGDCLSTSNSSLSRRTDGLFRRSPLPPPPETSSRDQTH